MEERRPELIFDVSSVRCYGASKDKRSPVIVRVNLGGDYLVQCSCLYTASKGETICTEDGRPFFSCGECLLGTREKFDRLFG